MGEVPKWLPSDDEIDAAALSRNPFEYEGTDELRALIRTTVQKALTEQKAEWANQIALERKKLASDPVYAEKAVIFELRRELAGERDKWTSYFGASAQNFLEQEEKTERRHRREVLQAKIDTLDDLWRATKRDHSGKAAEVAFASHVTPNFIREEVARLAAELAALGST